MITERIKKFAEASPELYTAWRDYADHYMEEKRNIQGKKFCKEFSLKEKSDTINKLYIDEIVKRSGYTLEKFDNDIERFAANSNILSFANAIRDYMIDMILPETLIQSIGIIADIKTADWGDSLTFDLENNALFNVTEAGYRQRDVQAQQLFNTSVTLNPVNHMITVKVDLPAVLRNTMSIAEFTMKAVRSIETQLYYDTYEAFDTAVQNADMPAALKITNYTEDSLISLCQTVQAYNQGRKPIILGTARALKSVLPSNDNTRIFLEDEFNTTLGHMRTFNGYDVIEMVQVADKNSSTYGLKLNDSIIYVVSPSSDKVIKVGLGGTLSHTSGTYDKANLSQFSTINKSWAVKCVTNSIAGAIVLG